MSSFVQPRCPGSKSASAVILSVVLLLLLACGEGPAEEEGPALQKLILANVHPEGYPTARGLRFFADKVLEDPLLESRFDLDVQLAGVLGNEKEALEKLGFGGIQMACTSVAPLAEFSRTIGVLTLPYLFRDPEHMWQVLDGEIGEELLSTLEANGLVGLAWYDSGSRSFYNRQRPVRRLEDLAGLKIRVQKSEIMREMVEALGASPVSLGFKEVYTSLHTGAIDGAENNVPSYRSERHFEVAKYYSYDRHSTIPDLLLINLLVWQRLVPEERVALRQAAKESSLAQRGYWQEYVEEALVAVRAAGSEIHQIEDVEVFQQAVEPLYAKYGARYGDLVERIRAVGSSAAELPSVE